MVARLKMPTLMVLMLTLVGCQHIQTARSPIPVTLHPNAAQQASDAQLMLDAPINQTKPSADVGGTGLYLLENWF